MQIEELGNEPFSVSPLCRAISLRRKGGENGQMTREGKRRLKQKEGTTVCEGELLHLPISSALSGSVEPSLLIFTHEIRPT